MTQLARATEFRVVGMAGRQNRLAPRLSDLFAAAVTDFYCCLLDDRWRWRAH